MPNYADLADQGEDRLANLQAIPLHYADDAPEYNPLGFGIRNEDQNIQRLDVNELNEINYITVNPLLQNPNMEWLPRSVLLDSPFFLQAIQDVIEVKKNDESMEGMMQLNELFIRILHTIEVDNNAHAPIESMFNQLNKIYTGTFEWVFEIMNMPVISNIFELFDIFDRDQNYKYINFEQIRLLLPIKVFSSYLSKPFSSNEIDAVTYGDVVGFHSLVLRVFTKIYIRSFMAMRPHIDATEIFTIDPFMRNEIRRSNIKFYSINFWGDDDFEIYSFLEQLIDNFVLSGLPKWIMKETPFLLPLLELIDLLFNYGLISYDFAKPLLRNLYLTSETLKSLEAQISVMERQTVDMNKCRSEFTRCRELISSILVHVLTLFCDYAMEMNVLEQLRGVKNIQYFKDFLFADKASYTYFCSIVIKYLSNHVSIQGGLESEVLDDNLVILYSFIGDFQNDSFILSMELVKSTYYDYYLALLSKSVHHNLASSIAMQISSKVQDYVENFQRTNGQYQISEFEKLLQDLEIILEPHYEREDLKLELSIQNFSEIWLSLISVQPNSCHDGLIDRALIILQKVLVGNYPGQSVLFRGAGYANFFNILMKHNFSALILLNRVFEHDSFLLYLSHDMFMLNLNIYKERLDTFSNEIQTFVGSLSGLEQIPNIAMKIGTLFFFNLYFDSVLEDHLIKIDRRKRYDTLLANELVEIVTTIVLPMLGNPKIFEEAKAEEPITFINPILKMGIDQKEEIMNLLNKTSPKLLLIQFLYFVLKLFNKSTFKIYTGSIYEKITEYNITQAMETMSSASPESVLLRLELVKILDRFYVFYQNHLITRRLIHSTNKNLYFGESFIPPNFENITTFVIAEFKWFEDFMNLHTNKDARLLQNIRKYIFKGLLGMITKYLKAVSAHMSKLLLDDVIKKLKVNTDLMLDELQPRFAQFTRIAGSEKGGNPSYLNSLSSRKSLIGKKDQYLPINEDKEEQSFENDEPIDEVDNIEERINPNIKLMRLRMVTSLSKLNKLYKDTKYGYIVDRYIRKPIQEDRTPYMTKVFQNSATLRKNFGTVMLNMFKNNPTSKFEVQFKRLKYAYREVKLSYQENRENNQFYNVLKSIKDAKQNLRNIILYFTNHFMHLKFLSASEKPKKFYLNNEFFFNCLVILDNLSIWNSKVKEEFLIILHEMHVENRKLVLTNLWGTYISLYLLVTFKTFMDKEWETFWGLFYIVSTFIQNLCEENNLKFKSFFSNTYLAFGAISTLSSITIDQSKFSIFFECYIMLENTANFTEFWLTRSSKIVPSDRVELFPIFKRLFAQVTEFITGPCLENQLKIYRFRIDLWSGIINRIIDDLDSRFYEVKLACLNFISGLMEGQDNNIVIYMGSNFQISKLYSMIVQLTKKLYIRQILANKVEEDDSFKLIKSIRNVVSDVLKINTKPDINENKIVDSEITAEQEKAHNIRDYKKLMQMYRKNKDTFSDHLILDVVLTTYVMLINMSFKLKFYEFFLKERDEETKKYLEMRQKFDPEKTDELIIHLFLTKITANIEITYKNEENHRLIRVYFRRPADCFFLTVEMKLDFLKNCNYSSIQNKHIALFDSVGPFYIEMQTNKRYYEKFGRLYQLTTTDFFRHNQIVLYLLSVLLNIIMLVFTTSIGATDGDLTFTNRGGRIVTNTLAIIIVSYSGLLSLLWIVFKYRLEVAMEEKRYMVYHTEISSHSRFKIRIFKCLLLHPQFISLYLNTLFTVLGLAISDPFFYTLSLFLIGFLFKTVSYILESIIKHYGKLLITLALTILVIFSYSFILYKYFRNEVNSGDFEPDLCDDFLYCFLNSVNIGLRGGGGVSDAFFLAGKLSKGGKFFGRFFFDLTFFILIKLIFLNLVAGIIIDTFSTMRDELTQRSYTMYNFCFICGKSRWQLEKEGIGYKSHIMRSHSMWKYLYYMIRLTSVKSSSFNGVEQYIYEKIMKDDSSWIPQGIYLKENVNYVNLDNRVAGIAK